MEERDFYTESEVLLPALLECPRCRTRDTYELRWVKRVKKQSVPPRANEQDRRRFAAARSYSVRKDDLVSCKNIRCRKRFEVSGIQTVAFL